MPKINLIPWLLRAIQLGAQREIGVPAQGDFIDMRTNLTRWPDRSKAHSLHD